MCHRAGSLGIRSTLWNPSWKGWRCGTYDGPDEAVGPLLAGCLRGRAQLAMNLRLPDPTGHIDIGDSALVRLSVVRCWTRWQVPWYRLQSPAEFNPSTCAIGSAFGEAEQLQATQALEVFFEFRRGRLPIPEWSVQWELNLEEAVTHAGLEVNQVAKTYLGQKSIDDLLLQVHGDMRRIEELRTLLPRMAHRHPDQQTTLYEDTAEENTYYDDNDSWSTVTGSWKMNGKWWLALWPWLRRALCLVRRLARRCRGLLVWWWPQRWTRWMAWALVRGWISWGTSRCRRGDLHRAFEQHGWELLQGQGQVSHWLHGLGLLYMRLEVAQHAQLPFEQSVAVQRIRQVRALARTLEDPWEKDLARASTRLMAREKENPTRGTAREASGLTIFLKALATTTAAPTSWIVSWSPSTSRMERQPFHLRLQSLRWICLRKRRFSSRRKWSLRSILVQKIKENRLWRSWTSLSDKLTTSTTTTWCEVSASVDYLWILERLAGWLAPTPWRSCWTLEWCWRTARTKSPAWGPSTTTVTGISGQSDSTLARVSLPFSMPDRRDCELPGSYTADLIGG